LGLKFKESEVGLIPEDWNINELKSRAIITMGQSPKSDTYNNVKIGIPFMQGRKTFGDKYPHIDTWCTDPKRIAKKNDVLISVRAPVGDVNIAVEDICIGRGLASLRMKNGNNEFLYYLLKNYVGEITSRGTGTVFASIDKEGLETLKLPFPSDLEQKAIAHILSTLDEKIETNNQINEKLEEMAQALFKHWFVDFEFPNENGKPYKSSGGEMVESELGMIPKGWEALYLNQVVEVKYGRNLPTKDLTDSGYPVFGGNGLIGFYTKYLYKDPQVLIACRGAASGKVLLSLPFSFVTNNSLILENNQKIVSFEYLSQFCLFYEFYNFVTGSAQPQITINNLNKAKILIPNKKLHDEYTNVISALNTKILKLKKETEILKQIRDTLLPKLMSGEIRIPMEDGVLSEKN
jgi:type I restriction enzyme, S subunit